MTFDISPMQSTTSQLALLSALQGAAASDDFAILLDRGAEGVAHASTIPAEMPVRSVTGDAIAAAPSGTSTELAIAQADALAAALAPAPQAAEAPAKSTDAKPEPIVLPQFVQLATRPDALRNIRKDARNEDRPAAPDKNDNSDPSGPAASEISAIVIPVPVAAGTSAPQPATATPQVNASASHRGAISEPVSLAASQVPEAPSRTALPQAQAAELPEEEPVIPPAQVNPIKAGQETLSPKAPMQQEEHASIPKAAPVRAARVAEIALGLTDVQPDPATMIAQKGLADLPASAAGTANAPAPGTAPASSTIVDRQLDLVRNEQWLGELAHDIASASGDNNRLSFRLMPQQLGRLDVDVARSHDGLSLTIRTESDSAQAILTAAQPRLADEIRAQGLKLADTQMFSGDARQSPGQEGSSRPAPLIETFTQSTEIVDAPETEQRDGLYA